MNCFKLPPLHPRESVQYSFHRRLGEPQSRPGRDSDEKTPAPATNRTPILEFNSLYYATSFHLHIKCEHATVVSQPLKEYKCSTVFNCYGHNSTPASMEGTRQQKWPIIQNMCANGISSQHVALIRNNFRCSAHLTKLKEENNVYIYC